jgi:uncharacterized membrane protein
MDRHRHPANIVRHDEQGRGGRIADAVTSYLGSWSFIVTQTVVVAAWIALNVVGLIRHWDVYPFVLLNLAFSLQAAYTGPLVLLSSNRSAEHDRARAEHAYRVGEDTLTLLEKLHDEHAELRRQHRDLGEQMVVVMEKLQKPPARRPAAKPATPRAKP